VADVIKAAVCDRRASVSEVARTRGAGCRKAIQNRLPAETSISEID